MVDPTPLFDDEDPRPSSLASRAAVSPPVMPTLLDFDTSRDQTRAPAVSVILGIGEDPLMPLALARGERLFPSLMASQGHLIRNMLSDLIPLDFARLSNFGRDTLDRTARLTIAVAVLNDRFHALDPETLVNGVVERAKAHMIGHQTSGLRAMLANLVPFDLNQARAQLDAARRLADSLVREAIACAEDMGRLDRLMRTEVAALAILNDLADHGSMGDLLIRRSVLLDAAKQQLTISAKQAEALRQLIEQWIMRIDETRDATLTAIGFSTGL